MAVRFIHTADWQLGMTRHFFDAEGQANFNQARSDAIKTIGTIVAEEEAEFVVVAGDVFESNRVRPRTVLRALEAMGNIPVPVYLLPGNHDPLDAASVFTSRTFTDAKPANVTVLDDSRPISVRPGIEVIGAPWMSRRPLSDLVGAACGDLDSEPGTIRIVVGHGQVDEVMPFENPAAIRIADAEAAIEDGRVAFVALGDRHSVTDVGRTGRVWYAGSPEPTDYDETDAGNVLLVDIDADTCTVTQKRTGTWHFAAQQFELASDADLDALAAWLDQQESRDRSIVKLTLVGSLSLTQNARLQEVLDGARVTFAAVEEWERHADLVVRPDDDDFSDLSLAGYAGATVAELREIVESGGEEADAAIDALALVARLVLGSGSAAE
jgi:DNA repair exonuclease SbcCD nuclease subunit